MLLNAAVNSNWESDSQFERTWPIMLLVAYLKACDDATSHMAMVNFGVEEVGELKRDLKHHLLKGKALVGHSVRFEYTFDNFNQFIE